jgi:hypothetical protein
MTGEKSLDSRRSQLKGREILRSIPSGRPRGVFRAVSTRDGEAITRDGQSYFRANFKGKDHSGEVIYEIEFADGMWMLATDSDLEQRP